MECGNAESVLKRLLQSCSVPDGLVEISQGSHRGLACSKEVKQGNVIFSLPWHRSLNPRNAVANLKLDDERKHGILQKGTKALLKEVKHSNLPGVTIETAWILLLVLHILREFRNPKSSWQSYIQMLPCPAGSRMKNIACHGTDATDLLFFSEEELDSLHYMQLKVDVMQERVRLQELYSHLFGKINPAVSFESWLWAHCLVRSRSLDLTGSPMVGDAKCFRARCLLPVIDLCNHGGNSSNIHLSVRLGTDGFPRWVDVVATRKLPAHAELLLNYGDRPLRDFLQGYGFVPDNHMHEEFQDFGAKWQSLQLRATTQEAHQLRLRSIHCLLAGILSNVSARDENHPQNQATQSLMYVIGDWQSTAETTSLLQPLLTLPNALFGQNSSEKEFQTLRVPWEEEAGISEYLAGALQELLESQLTSIQEDAYLLSLFEKNKQDTETYQSCRNAQGTVNWSKDSSNHDTCIPVFNPCLPIGSSISRSSDKKQSLEGFLNGVQDSVGTENKPVPEKSCLGSLLTNHHLSLAISYRLRRKQMMQNMVESLRTHAASLQRF